MSVLSPGTDVENTRSWIILVFEREAMTPRGDTRSPGIRLGAYRGNTNAHPSRMSSTILTRMMPSYGAIYKGVAYCKATRKSPDAV